MTNEWTKSTEKAVLYPDDLPDKGLIEVLSEAPVEADDVPEDEARYGQWARIRDGTGDEKWMAAPVQVRKLIGEAMQRSNGENPVIQVHDATRGPADHDPWQIDGEVHSDGDPI